MKKNLLMGMLAICLTLLFMTGCATMKAEMKMSQNKYDEAASLYSEALAKNPDNYSARSKLGFAYFKSNKIDEAIAEFKKVLEVKPEEPYSTLYLGMAYMNKGDYAKTLEVWRGYKNPDQKLVEQEIQRMLTLVLMAESQKAAKNAMANEEKLGGIELDKNTVAVTYFADLSADKSLRPFQKALAAMVTTDLAKIKSLKVVERARLQALVDEMKLSQLGITDPKTAARMGRLLKAENVVAGSIALGTISVTVSHASASTGSVKKTANFHVETKRFYDLPPAIIETMANSFGITLSAAEKEAIGTVHTKSLKAFEYFGNAMDALDKGDWKLAQNFFSKCLKEDPNFKMARGARDSSPSGSSPGLDAAPEALAAAIEKSVDGSVSDQTAADSQAAACAAGGGGNTTTVAAPSVDSSPGPCFAADTLVLMADNTLRPISEIELGDVAMAINLKSGKRAPGEVVDLHNGVIDHYILLNGEIKVSTPHPFFSETGKWVNAEDLKAGDRVQGLDGAVIEINAIEKIKTDSIRLYNFEVENSHNFLVTTDGKTFYVVQDFIFGISCQ